MSLQFNLLGSLSIETDGGPSDLLKGPKGCALVAYLIVTRQTHTREFLADLLWEATTTAQALHNLRALLNRIRDLVPELQITRTILVFQPLAETTVDFLSLQAVLDQDLAQIDLSQLDPRSSGIAAIFWQTSIWKGLRASKSGWPWSANVCAKRCMQPISGCAKLIWTGSSGRKGWRWHNAGSASIP